MIKMKQVHLVVAGDALPGIIVDQAGAADALLVVGGDGGGAADNPDPVLL
jgi:hypothetical protein